MATGQISSIDEKRFELHALECSFAACTKFLRSVGGFDLPLDISSHITPGIARQSAENRCTDKKREPVPSLPDAQVSWTQVFIHASCVDLVSHVAK